MYLKRVEMKNFKSFRDVTVPFEPGFTGITGPNGSGKSNISDAILFVLGTTSSKQIRAGRLGDLIHNGGKKGRPAKECKVSLVFDNTDRTIPLEQDEIKLTRRVKKSPSDPDTTYSYYYVNGESSSLTEFEDLLSHARISADGYNIVQQGDVTRIVTMSNVERRRLLDDIAGITRFDKEIDDAEARREEVEDNLDRTRLILREVQQSLKMLAEEKERAAEYRELRESLQDHKAKLAKKRVVALEQELSNVHESIDSYKEEGQQLAEKRAKVEERVQELTAKLDELDEEMAEMGGEDARERQERLQELREEAATARQMTNHFKDEVQGVEIDLQEVQATHKKAETALDELIEERDEVAQAIEKWKAEAEELEAELEETKESISEGSEKSHELQRELAQLKQEFERAQEARHEARMAADGKAERLERLEAELAGLEEKLETAEFESKDVRWAAKEAKKKHEELKEEKEELSEALFEAKKEQTELTDQLQELEPRVRKLQNEYSQAKAELNAHENATGFSRAVDAVIEARDKGELKGICGTIAELGSPQEGVETALEVAAGGRMQAVVVEDDEVASQAIEFLKKKKVGRVTFLPLSKLSSSRPRGKALMASRDDDAVGFAVDLIEYDDKYDPAFSYVFRDTLVVETLTAARRLMGGVRLVTVDGELIDAGGAITGGSLSKRRASFGVKRREEIEKLAKKLQSLVAEQEHLAEQKQEITDRVRQLQEQLREVEAQLVKNETERAEAERRAKDAEERIERMGEQKDELDEQVAALETELEEAREELEQAQATMEELDAQREKKSKQLMQSTQKALADKLEELRAERDEVKDALRDLDARAQALEEKVRVARERRDEVAQRVAELEAKKNEFETEIEGYKTKEENLREEIGVLEEMVAAHDEEVTELRQEREEVLEQKYKQENEADKLQDAIDANSDLVVQFKGRVPVVEESLREAKQELAALPVEPPESVEETQEDLKAEVRTIEDRMQRLEPVNMRALEEYEEQEGRKEELESELERLEEERESLVELADALIGKKKDALMEVFDEVNQNFQQMFSDISGGGKAELKLENEVNPFEGGLVLKSQPQGKKVHRLEALSGGEKSLTALSFIFAVQKYAPSPFYVLDEVDMFLDGVNSELVAKMVHRGSQRAQFIMVSLRKVTLKLADHVYGVTMRNGISEILGTVDVDSIPSGGAEAPAALDAAVGEEDEAIQEAPEPS